ncbi:MAG TPA: glutamine--fructose-6-phosphate transaminase (isomerizing) [Candidatus Paceibacterota bacterium]
MCGIMGYIGKRNALPIVIDGLKKLEYRGYDSAGVALWDGKDVFLKKTAGRVSALENSLSSNSIFGTLAISHTRWATHGKPTDQNAHPHSDCSGSVFAVHNGILENYRELKEVLIREGHKFSSETDTEILPHLIERSFLNEKNVSLEDASLEALRHIEGTFGIAVISKQDPNKIFVARRGSPLILGIGNEEYVVASDASAVIGITKNVVYLRDNECAVITPDSFKVFNFSRKAVKKPVETLEWNVEDAQKGGFPHFMKKEIFEEPETLRNTFRGRLLEEGFAKLGGLEDIKEKFFSAKRILIVACGTSYFSGLLGKYYFEEICGIPASVEHASEFRYRDPVIDDNVVVIAISQSGETADTLEALREAKRKGALTLGIVNVVGSTIARESDAGVYNHAGPEIGVASTKAFVSQLGVLLLMALFLSQRSVKNGLFNKSVINELKAIPAKMEKILKLDSEIKNLAQKYISHSNFLFVGRKYHYPVALEGALKLKEISYRHAEGYAMGEMKHGPLALIDEQFPTVVLSLKDSVYEKVVSNIQEIRARCGKVIVVATEGDTQIKKISDDVIYIPQTLEILNPLLSVLPLQLFAYHTASLLGLDVDKPRNLAKSVTVE